MNDQDPKKAGRADLLFGGGALLSGVAASLCCVGPLAFAALGLGTFGLASFFDRARPFLALALAAFGALALFLTPKAEADACPDGSCPTPSVGRRGVLWALVLAGLAFYLVPLFL